MPLAAGGTEKRFACHYHFDTSVAPSDAYTALLKSMGGRRSDPGGLEYIVPAYWQGPSFDWSEKDLTAAINWDPFLSYKDFANRVTGTYTAPNFPYNAAGNAYDSGGYDYLGHIQNNFQFGFTATSFPQYAADPQHGYAADQYLNADSGVTAAWDVAATYGLGDVVSYTRTIAGVPFASVWESLGAGNTGNTPGPTSTHWVDAAVPLPMEISLSMVLSISQAQRLAKIALMRSRQQGGGTFEMGMRTFGMQDFDVMHFSYAGYGWANKVLEVTNVTLRSITEDGAPGELPKPPELRLLFDVHETASSVYDWDPVEEQSIYDIPILGVQQARTPAAPTSLALTSGASTAVVQPDGTLRPRIKATWTGPLDGLVARIETQFQKAGDAAWTAGPLVDVALTQCFFDGVIAGDTYNVRIRSRRPRGATFGLG